MKKSPFSSPKGNSPRGVGFFHQFPRQFLRPYGEADKTPSTETVFKRIKPFTCEWLLRPKVAISELSDTVLKNLDILTNKDQTVVDCETVKKLVNEIKPVRKHLETLHKDGIGHPAEKDVVQTLKFLFAEKDEMDSLVDEMFHVGGALFATAAQLIVARTLVRNPENYADLVEADETGSDRKFKNSKDIQSMRDFIVADVLGNSKPKPAAYARKDLLKQFDYPTKALTGRETPTILSSSSDESSSSSSEDEREKQKAVDKQRSTSTLNTKKSKPSRSSSEEKEGKNKKGVQQQAKTNHVAKGKRSGLELLAADEIVLKPPKKKKSRAEK